MGDEEAWEREEEKVRKKERRVDAGEGWGIENGFAMYNTLLIYAFVHLFIIIIIFVIDWNLDNTSLHLLFFNENFIIV